MNPDTAEPPVVEPPGELAVPLDMRVATRAGRRSTASSPLGSWLAALRGDPVRMAAVRASAGALAGSRLLIWGAAIATILVSGFGPVRGAFNPPGLTRGFGRLGDLLAAPAARWDGSWYLVIAHYGYRPDLGVFTAPRTAFFPLYPLGLRGVSWLGAPPVLAGVLVSFLALAAALYGIHRLTTLELGGGGDARARAVAPARAGLGADAVATQAAGLGTDAVATARAGLGTDAVATARAGLDTDAVATARGGLGTDPVATARADRGIGAVATARADRGIGAVATAASTIDARVVAGTGEAAHETARLAVLLTAFAPMAFFLSAVYSESLYLALSVGLFWSARQGRWMYVGVLGALAAATRSTGLVLLAPALIIYLYGPREDRIADLAGGGGVTSGRGWRGAPAWMRRLRPRYRVRRDILWLALMPLGVLAYGAFLAAGGGDALAPLHAQDVWGRHFAGPYLGVWDGVKAAVAGARQLLSPQSAHVYFPAASGSPTVSAEHNLVLFGFLALALPALVGVLRRLPLAYGAYTLAALALPLSYPVTAQPLMSLPRFLLVLFPLTMVQAGWLAAHPRARRPLLALSAVLLAVFAAQFATWHWVA